MFTFYIANIPSQMFYQISSHTISKLIQWPIFCAIVFVYNTLFCFTAKTKFTPAFEKAFELLRGSISEDSAKNKKRVILFLTDGHPTDSKETLSLFETIRNRNLELNNSVIILTYGFDSKYQEILIDIAHQNTTKYGVPANTSVGDIAVIKD